MAELASSRVETLVLASLARGVGHGYAIISDVKDRSGGAFALNEGAVYPVLHKLELDGLVSSRWAQVSGRRRRVYALTRRGRAALGKQRRSWAAFAASMDLALGVR